jgi:hypothetical protein
VVQTAPANGHEAIRGSLEKPPLAYHFIGQRATMLASLASRFDRSLQCDRSDGNCRNSAGGGRR